MSLARSIIEFSEELPAVLAGFNPFGPEAAEVLATGPAADLAARIDRRLPGSDPTAMLLLCLQVLEVYRQTVQPHVVTAEFVATLPQGSPSGARPTVQVVQEMLGRARSEVIAVGYEISDQRMLDGLHAASARHVDVLLICDRERGSGKSALAAWPAIGRRPRVFQDRLRSDATRYASMHCKTLIVDGQELLTSSANFTFHGLTGNIEFGIHLSGGPAARARELFRDLVQSDLLEQLSAE